MKTIKRLFCIIAALLLAVTSTVALADGAAQYNANDAAKLRTFFEQVDAEGVKNGDKLFESYDPDDPATWTGNNGVSKVTWNENGRVISLSLGSAEHDLYGELDVSGMKELTLLDCSNGKLSSVNAFGCTKLTEVDASNNELESLNVKGCSSIKSINVSGNRLTELDLADCKGRITSINVSNNELTELELAGMAKLMSLSADHNRLTYIVVPSECIKPMTISCRQNAITEAVISGYANEIDLGGNPLVSFHMSPRGNKVDIVSDGHGAFDCVFIKNSHDPRTGETYDYLQVNGSPNAGCEYLGLFSDDELMCGPNEA